MSTTDLLVEYLILGSLANVWLTFTVNSVIPFSKQTVDDIANLIDKTSVIAIIVFIAITYTVGGLINFIANRLGSRYQQGYRDRVFLEKAGIPYKGTKDAIGAREVLSRASPDVAQRFRSDGHIIRVSRGNALNFLCLGTVLTFYIQPYPFPAIIGVAVSFLLAVLSFFWWRRTFRSNYEQMVDVYKGLLKQSQNNRAIKASRK